MPRRRREGALECSAFEPPPPRFPPVALVLSLLSIWKLVEEPMVVLMARPFIVGEPGSGDVGDVDGDGVVLILRSRSASPEGWDH
jgi:hypothetical protein